ncbi:EAL domain-containing protein, partial [Photobacterium phosphoreum]|uniref:EAL domain-containing protein n=1 Tax=Photobacterium phosphoreum TaxID=659 RepID=UPI001E3190F5
SVFIPIAEQTGTIIRLGEWVLRQACLALTQPSLKDSTISLSINVSPNQFKQLNFVAMVKRVLTETKAPANRLVLEITEGVLIENMEEVQIHMDELSAIGIRISIDDFGTGYSNLSTLNQLSLYELKIDQSLTFGISTDPNSAVIIRLILAMARQLGLSVIAEGVETQDQADFLIDNGCDSLQGYLYMRPLPLNQWLQQIDTMCNKLN